MIDFAVRGVAMTNPPSRELLCRLADSFGVSTEYWAFGGQLTAVKICRVLFFVCVLVVV